MNRAWWTVGALSFVSLLDWADRALISVTAEPIKHEFDLTDTELGILMGAAFVFSRLLMTVPIGRMSDKRSRRNITAWSLGIVSLATIAFGYARGYAQLIAARVALGAGAAGTAIPGLSMVADLFPLRKRGRAMGLWQLGGAVGWAAGAAIAAWVTQIHGWRTTTIYFGAFGIAVTVLFLLTVREPARRDSTGMELAKGDAPPLGQVFAFMLRQPSLKHISVGFMLLNAFDMLIASWIIVFFVRSHGMELGETGTIVGLILLAGGAPGTLLGGWVLDWLGKRDIRWHCWLNAAVAAVSIVLAFGMYLAASPWFAMAAFLLNSVNMGLWYAASATVSMGLAGSRMRAIVYAVFSLFIYVGYALGPAFAGYISTQLEPWLGTESLRYAMLASIVMLIWAGVHFLFAARTIEADYARASNA